MTDNEIIKALECCSTPRTSDCRECPYRRNELKALPSDGCCNALMRDAIAFINRQKADIERLKDMVGQNEGVLPQYENLIIAEAIKEFAERLKERKYQSSDWSHGEHPYVVEESDIDEILEEMTEETP